MEGSCIYRRDCEHLRDIKPILRHPYLTDTCSDTHIKVASQPLRTARSSLQTPARRFQLRPISTALQPAPASCTNDDGIQVGAMVAPPLLHQECAGRILQEVERHKRQQGPSTCIEGRAAS
jgi:hypothetical protein